MTEDYNVLWKLLKNDCGSLTKTKTQTTRENMSTEAAKLKI